MNNEKIEQKTIWTKNTLLLSVLQCNLTHTHYIIFLHDLQVSADIGVNVAQNIRCSDEKKKKALLNGPGASVELIFSTPMQWVQRLLYDC